MEQKPVNQRVNELRLYMQEHGLSAFIFPSTDPHSGEYVPDHWMTRQWISGFDGSAGTAVVTLQDAALWTDSRYFLAAADQLSGTPFRLMKEGVEGTPSIAQWLCSQLTKGQVVGMDGWVNTIDEVEDLREELTEAGLTLNLDLDPAEALWADRPCIPMHPVEPQPLGFAGETVQSKLLRLRQRMRELGCEATVVSQLDEIAWLTNLRGTDVHCNPVFVSYLLVTQSQAVLFVNPDKITDEIADFLKEQGIERLPYDRLSATLESFREGPLLLDAQTSNYNIIAHLSEACEVRYHNSVIAPMKAIKNEAEIQGFHNAMKRDGVALVKFLRWLLPAVQAGGETEISVDRKLTGLRAEQPLFRDISFDTIAGYAAHGAIVHYEATPETDIPLEPRGLLLLDSGAQYQDGTTDITRTIALGPVTEEEKLDYTLVLKGHIRLAMTKFPKGASGTQVDAMARYAMWQHGINFMHGTGHGVGSYLNVHEGPHQIRMNWKPAPMVAGMTVTDEPGIYRAGKHGVRTENTMLITPYMNTEFGEFVQLEPLTLCPIDTTPILWDLMAPDEVDYLDRYHQRVYDELAPLLDEDERVWLKEKTAPSISPKGGVNK